MKKDKNWLKEQLSYLQDGVGESFNDYSEGLNAAYNTLEIIIDQLEEPEQEKVVVPQFVADWIELCKKRADLSDCLRGSFNYGQGDFKTEIITEDEDWLFEYDHADLVARAWLDGYLVEKEKRYYVYDKATKSYLGYNAVRTQLNWWTSRLENESFTEQEIKNIDERYWAFAEEITK